MKYCLYMCCHSGFSIVPPLFEPIQCGAALNAPVPGALRDDSGENISALNREYCELTAHYHAWKNISADFYGFCHYRRFFAPCAATSRPYIVRRDPDGQYAGLLGNGDQLERLINEHDIIAPRSENMGLSASEHYCTSVHHFSEDLRLFTEILKENSPAIAQTADAYLAQDRQYFCNMFIMDRKHFEEYCGILFPALAEFDRRKTRHGYFQADRTDGYLGEIFTGIFITWAKERGADVAEIPRLDTGCSQKKMIGCALLPPESKRRFIAKRFAKRMKRK